MVKEWQDALQYLLSLNVAAQPFFVCYSFAETRNFDAETQTWTYTRIVYKWATNRMDHNGLGRQYISSAQCLVEYVSNELDELKNTELPDESYSRKGRYLCKKYNYRKKKKAKKSASQSIRKLLGNKDQE